MSAVERFLTMFEPENNKVAFRIMLDEMVKEIKRKAEIDSEPLMMRDYFASSALQGLLANGAIGQALPPKNICERAYAHADWMIKVKEEK